MASVVMIALAVVFVGVLRSVTEIDVKTAGTADARITMEAMTRSLRVAVKPSRPSSITAAFTSATTNSVSFYSLLNRSTSTATATAAPDPSLVSYSWNGTCINQTVVAMQSVSGTPTWTGTGTVTCLARTSVAPVFTYYTSGSSTATALSATDLVSASKRATIKSVAITVTVQDASHPAVRSVQLAGRVTLDNIS